MTTDAPGSARRIRRLIGALGVGGAVVLAGARGVWWGVSFLGGAGLAFASFWVTHKLVETLGPPHPDTPPEERTGSSKAVLLGMRYVLIGMACYGMINGLGLHLKAVLGGLLVGAAATLLEVLYELIHGTRNTGYPPV